MRTPRRARRGRGLGLGSIVLVLALAGTAYAFAASNTVPATRAGDGSQAISGYTISSVAYGLNPSSPQNIDSVTFTISPTSATTVKASLNGGTTWYSCTNSSGSVSCTTTSPQATVAGATNLEVVATG
jgi:hypothetical protein